MTELSFEQRLMRMERIVHRSRMFAAIAIICAIAIGVVAVGIAHGRQPRYPNIIVDEDGIGVLSQDGWIRLTAHGLSMSDKNAGTVINSGRIQMADNLRQHTHNVEIKPSDLTMSYSPNGANKGPTTYYELGVDEGFVRVSMAGHEASIEVDDGKHQTTVVPGDGVRVRQSELQLDAK